MELLVLLVSGAIGAWSMRVWQHRRRRMTKSRRQFG
jgi:hypothetical protein